MVSLVGEGVWWVGHKEIQTIRCSTGRFRYVLVNHHYLHGYGWDVDVSVRDFRLPAEGGQGGGV